jgi:tripartite-type tricarboxylate transporter receptor subunit TctC
MKGALDRSQNHHAIGLAGQQSIRDQSVTFEGYIDAQHRLTDRLSHRGSNMRAISLVVLAVTGLVVGTPLWAQQAWPQKPVRLIIGFAAGTSVDTMARLAAARLQERWGQPVTIEPVVGAAGNLAAERVAKAPPDGQTLLWSGNAAIVVNPALYPRLGYDPLTSFAPITLVVQTPNVLVVHPSVPARSVRELIALAKARPGALTYASAGVGTSTHIAGELLRVLAGAELLHVPYKGAQGIISDVVSGRVDMTFANIGGAAPEMVKQGRLRALAVTSTRRSALLPEMPTIAESGFPGFEAIAWFGVLAPQGTPDRVLNAAHRDIATVMASPELRSRYSDMGLEVVANTPSEFAAVIARELPKWRRLVQEAGIKLE